MTSSLEAQRIEFASRRLVALPLAGMIAVTLYILERRWHEIRRTGRDAGAGQPATARASAD